MYNAGMSSDARVIPALVLGASLAILGGALAFQYIGGLQPCVLCIWQRYPYGVTIALGLLALLLADRSAASWLLGLAGLAFLVGGGIAAFHVGVEQHWWEGTASCGTTIDFSGGTEALLKRLEAAPVARCDEVPWSLFGISMAGYNVLLSAALAVICLGAARRGLKARPS